MANKSSISVQWKVVKVEVVCAVFRDLASIVMAENQNAVCFNFENTSKLAKWKVRPGNRISVGTILLLYEINKENEVKQLGKMKSNVEGTILKLLVKEGAMVEPGSEVLSYTEGACTHSIVMKDLCAECGADLRQLDNDQKVEAAAKASVSMVHSVPELRISEDQAQKLGKADEDRLLKTRKLVLLVDLDQTLIHTTNEEVPADMKGVFHFQLYGPKSPWYHTKLRPGTEDFLKKVSRLYELHIFTFGARLYAHHIACLLDSHGKYFSHRILSRDECFSQSTKCGNLKALFPCGDSLVCIIDDREDVWNFAPNMVPVKPYHFFTGTGDINAPPGSERREPRRRGFKSKSGIEGKIDSLAPIVSTNDKKDESQPSGISVPTENESAKDDNQMIVVNEKSKEILQKDLSETCDDEKNIDVKPENAHRNIKIKVENAKFSDLADENDLVEKDVCLSPTSSVISETSLKLESIINGEGTTNENANETITTPDETKLESDLDEEQVLVNKLEDSNIEDDYLMYLEEILTMIHKAFYDLYDQLKSHNKQEIPDLKKVIPYVRRKVLQNVNVVFSGVIPTNMEPEKSKLWMLAKSLGANVFPDLVSSNADAVGTTHLVAAKLGTIKVNKAKKMRGVSVVNPDWLWCCAERWEKVDERLFPLTDEIVLKNPFAKLKKRYFHGPQNFESYKNELVGESSQIKNPLTSPKTEQSTSSTEDSESTNFSNSYSPLLSFSSDEITKMGQEVDDACSEESESETNDGELGNTLKVPVEIESESTSVESLSGGECPRGWKKRKKSQCKETEIDDGVQRKEEFGGIIETDDDEISSKFARREIPYNSEKSDNSDSDEFNDSIGSVDEEMAAAVEREFLK